ncbi:MAG: putative glyoxalase-like domain [Armatimonadetes bacterium]|jgi:catechol 2,3-dioxygenase-like lactoylglutathione lyase family enzyme|nr:putative glyoxalase-like domain [Armatimonadota bacterium]
MIRIDHINIVVSEMERSVRFYTELLGLRRGFETTLQGEWVERVTGLPGAVAHCVFLETDDPTVRLELLQYHSPAGERIPPNSLPNTHGLRHLAFTVDGAALELLVQRLDEAAVPVVSEPVRVPFRVANLGQKRLFYFHDPDGAIIELAAYDPA